MRCFGRKLALLIGLAVCCTVTQAVAQTPFLLAQAQPPAPKPYAVWMLECLGLMGLLSVLSGAAVFIGACLVVLLARRPAVIASYLPFLLLPLLFGALEALKGSVSSFAVLATSGAAIRQSQIFAGLSESLVPILAALMATLPSYFVVAIGLFVRTLIADGRSTTHGRTAEPSPGMAVPMKGPTQP